MTLTWQLEKSENGEDWWWTGVGETRSKEKGTVLGPNTT